MLFWHLHVHIIGSNYMCYACHKYNTKWLLCFCYFKNLAVILKFILKRKRKRKNKLKQTTFPFTLDQVNYGLAVFNSSFSFYFFVVVAPFSLYDFLNNYAFIIFKPASLWPPWIVIIKNLQLFLSQNFKIFSDYWSCKRWEDIDFLFQMWELKQEEFKWLP